MSPLKECIILQLKLLMSTVAKHYPHADEGAVKLIVIDQIKNLKLAEVQPEDERKAG